MKSRVEASVVGGDERDELHSKKGKVLKEILELTFIQ